jgi:cytosine/adenosine deaminase-related metal-dependent hydrolase
MSSRVLLKDGLVLTLDPELGDLARADVLVEDSRIAGVGPDLVAANCELFDASGKIVVPGFVDTHRHTWQTALRGICADWTLMDYFRGIRVQISSVMGPEDMYAGNYVGALEALDAGVTTVLDFSHCNNTPAHADEAVRGLKESGLRAIFAYGFYPVSLESPQFADHGARIEDARRVRGEHFSSAGGLVDMGIALTELGLVPLDATGSEVALARELDLLATAHIGTVADPGWPREVEILAREGLLDERQVHVHCNACTNAELDLLADAGAAVSVTPETEMQMGMGYPITGRALARGLRAGFGCDIVSLERGDVLTQARLGLQMQRALDNEAKIAHGEVPDRVTMSARQALELATTGGAAALGLGSELGSITPGKQADLVVFRTDGLSFAPPADPVASIVLHAHPGDVDAVLVAGRIVKRDGRLLDVDAVRARRLGEQSRERILSAVETRGGLLPEAPAGWLDAVRQAARHNVGLS